MIMTTYNKNYDPNEDEQLTLDEVVLYADDAPYITVSEWVDFSDDDNDDYSDETENQ